MNLYTGERWPIERHQEVVRVAERRAELLPGKAEGALASWLAARLRAAADRLDGRPAFEASRPVVVRSIRRPAP